MAESGIAAPGDLARLRAAGYDAFLIGESLMRQPDPGAALAELLAGAGAAMSLWIKICGNTSLEDALLAAEAGADALGFVFAPSPRQVTLEQVAAIVPRLPAAIEKIGVFVDAPFEEIAATVDACRLTGVQLHFAAPPSLPAALRARFGPGLRILHVVHFGPGAAAQAAALAGDAYIDALLVDSRTAAAVGGTGLAFDWAAARKTLFQNAAGWNTSSLPAVSIQPTWQRPSARSSPGAWTPSAALNPLPAAKTPSRCGISS